MNVRKMQNGNQEIVMTMDHQDVILIDNRHPDDQTMLEAIEAVTIGDLAHLEEGEIEAEIVEAPAMTEVPEISEDQEMIDLEIGMIADHAIEMIGDLKEETMEEVSWGIFIYKKKNKDKKFNLQIDFYRRSRR